jgi:uncharacterized membrane-anchored protein
MVFRTRRFMTQPLFRFQPNAILLGGTPSKVPEVTIYFWIIKILTTGMGETTSDFLVTTIDPHVAVVLGGIAFAVAMVLQFSASRYVPWVYWLAVVMVSVFGTMAADVMHVVLGVPYEISTPFFAVTLAVIFLAWYWFEKTLSIHSIHTTRREFFYWATVLTTFALGTAAGDMTAMSMNLGYLESGVMFAILFAIPAVAYWKFGLGAIPAFWVAYVLTRPLGASFADWLGVSQDRGGMDWGTGPVSLGMAILIFGFVGYVALTKKDVEEKDKDLLLP